jgi:hypothetical protein
MTKPPQGSFVESEKSKNAGWPGVTILYGFLTFLLFCIWTIKGVLPWQ